MKASWPLKYKYGDRICIIGPSGSGKTTVAKSILKQKQNVIILDTKHDVRDKFYEVGLPTRKLTGLRAGRFVWKADDEFITENTVQSAIFRSLLHSGPRCAYVDEANNLYPSRGLRLLATQGRGLRVSLIIGMQRPTGVPLFTITEASYWIVFPLVIVEDRERVEKAMGQYIPWNILEKNEHSFMVYDNKKNCAGPFYLKKRVSNVYVPSREIAV